ncbi:histidine acid phosphatase, partial [Rhizoctonia solani AG-3 Rhs1AP]
MDTERQLGPYSARYEVHSDISSVVPLGCNVTMINVLQRHGARYPTGKPGKALEATLAKLRNVQDIKEPSLQFIPTFRYHYIPGQLVPFGRAQSYISGQIIANKYSALGSRNFVRASNKARIVESSQWWKQGFEGRPFDVDAFNLVQPDLVILLGKEFNNTLGVETCPAAKLHKPSAGTKHDWLLLAGFAQIKKRLNKDLPGANLTESDAAHLMSLCGFDTAAKGGIASPWCGAFKDDEWQSYEYYNDLEKYYSDSYGSKYAPSEGVGWVNELIARLTNKAVEDHTTTNTTLDSSQATFPWGPNAPLVFADFSSDDNITKIISAMGIYPPIDIPLESIPTPSMVVSEIVPFAGCTVVEKISCSAEGAPTPGLSEGQLPPGDYVRVLINDAVVPLPSCPTLGYGMCALSDFVNTSQKFACRGGNFFLCFK